jgi:hypothetical protein
MKKCRYCPVKRGWLCPARNHRRYCDLAALGGDWPDRIVQQAEPAPSLAARAARILSLGRRALGAAWGHLRDRLRRVDAATYRRRLAACEACGLYDPTHGLCTVCGCIVAWKAALRSEDCPHPAGSRWAPAGPPPRPAAQEKNCGGCGGDGGSSA